MSEGKKHLDLEVLKKQAEGGDTKALLDLGFRYYEGDGVEKNCEEAIRCHRKAAELGEPEAVWTMGHRYLSAEGVTRDEAEANRFFISAAKLLLAKGDCLERSEKYILGSLYDDGLGVAQDFEKAATLYEAAAKEGSPEAYYGLGKLYHEGRGVVHDFLRAADCFRKSADAGFSLALQALAIMHFRGQGVPMDIRESERLYRLAADAGEPDAVSVVERIALLDYQTNLDERLLRITKGLLLLPRDLGVHWPWLEQGVEPSKKDANKFFLFAVLDYQMVSETVEENATRFANDVSDPEDLWNQIAAFDEREWKSPATKTKYALHRFPAGHNRLWDIANDLVSRYGGDARQIWRSQTPKVVLDRLHSIGRGKDGVGPELSRMIVGALLDTSQIEGEGDVKADVNVMRALGRAWRGSPYKGKETSEVTNLTRKMYPSNPWLLDQPLFSLGKTACADKKPACHTCFLRTDCSYAKNK